MTINEKFLEDIERIKHGYSTPTGIEMLGLPQRPEEVTIFHLNMAGNIYAEALRVIEKLLEEKAKGIK